MYIKSNKQGYGKTPINASSPFAERELTLSQIDSMLYNGEINRDEAQSMALQVLCNLDATKEVFTAVIKASR